MAGNISKCLREEILKLDNYRCRVRGCNKTTDLEVDHIIPRSLGGPNKLWNLITRCKIHHQMKTSRKISEIELLESIITVPDFRWGIALKWHKERKLLKEFKK